MADEQFNTSTNWWDNSSRNRFDSGSSSSSSGLNSFGAWPTAEIVDVKGRSSMECNVSVSDSSVSFHDTQKLQHDSSGATDLQMMGLALSSQAMDWNQALLRDDKGEGSYRSMLSSSTNYQQESGIGSSQVHWRDRMFSLDQPQFSPHGSSSDSTVTCQGLQSGFHMDSSAMYGSPSSTMFQGLLGSENHPQQQHHQHQSSFENRSMSSNYAYGATNYGISAANESLPSWPNKVPEFLRNPAPKQPPPHNQLHFSNNTPFWNASASAMSDVRPGFFPPLQPQFPSSNFEEKQKNIPDARESSSVVKKSGSEAATKRPRNETSPSPMPAFKARKEKMGDRITALQQLVSPFGKTDTASVLSEAIEYIKFLHEQVSVLSTPYMKSGASIHHHQQSSDKSKDPEVQKQDLRSRGLCLVPVSSTFPVTHETTVDFWNPTFGGTFR